MAVELSAFFDGMYTTAVAQMAAKVNVFVPDGQDLAGVLLLITLSWLVVTWLLSSDGSRALVDAIGVLARYSIVTMLLASWSLLVGGFFQSTANDMAKKLTGEQSVSATVGLMMASADRLLVMNHRLSKDCQNVGAPITDLPGMTPGTTSESVTGPPCLDKAHTNASPVTWVDMLVDFPMVLMTALLQLVSLGGMALFLAAYLTVIFMAEILFGAGMTFGPVLVPWLVWKQTEWLFDGWLKFMVTATLTKGVAAFMLMTCVSLITGLKAFSEQLSPPGASASDLIAVDEVAAFLICVVCFMGAYLMSQVPAIAGALTSGGSISSASFGGGAISRTIQRKVGGGGGGRASGDGAAAPAGGGKGGGATGGGGKVGGGGKP